MDPLAVVGAYLAATLCACLTAAAIAWFTAVKVSDRHAASLALLLAEARAHVERGASEMELWSKRGTEERARVESTDARRRGKAKAEEPPAPRYATVSAYKRALERGEQRDFVTEQALGLTQ